jgi:hypothetical protein
MIPTTSYGRQRRRPSPNSVRHGVHSNSSSKNSQLLNNTISRVIPFTAMVLYSLLRLSSMMNHLTTDGDGQHRWMMTAGPDSSSSNNMMNIATAAVKTTVFYHIQVTPQQQQEEDFSSRTKQQIQQQLRQIQQQTQTSAMSRNKSTRNAIRYHLDLPQDVAGSVDDDEWHRFVSQSCRPNDDCHPLDSKNNDTFTSSQHTLQYLWEFCQDHPDEYVTYLHNGHSVSSSSSSSSSRQRQRLVQEHNIGMIAAMECLSHPQELLSDTCTSCGLPFSTRPSMQHVTNQWTAPCSYVRNLIPPNEYPRKLQQMYRTLYNNDEYQCLRPHNITMSNFLRTQVLSVDGNDDEDDTSSSSSSFWTSRWIHSHPSLRPCNIIDQHDWHQAAKNLSQGLPTTLDWQIQPAPSTPFNVKGAPTAWQRLEGRLFEWQYINQPNDDDNNNTNNITTLPMLMLRPANDSWVYQHYQGAEQGIKCYKNYLSNEFNVA